MPRTKCLNSTSFAPCGLVARPVKKHHNNLVLSMETVLASYRWKVGYLAWHLGISLLKRQISHSGRSHELSCREKGSLFCDVIFTCLTQLFKLCHCVNCLELFRKL